MTRQPYQDWMIELANELVENGDLAYYRECRLLTPVGQLIYLGADGASNVRRAVKELTAEQREQLASTGRMLFHMTALHEALESLHINLMYASSDQLPIIAAEAGLVWVMRDILAFGKDAL